MSSNLTQLLISGKKKIDTPFAVGASSSSVVSLPAQINNSVLHLQLCTAESQPLLDLGFIAFGHC